MKIRALIDIDDTIADLISEWLKRYNRKYNDHLKKEDIRDWDLSKFTVPECGKDIYKFIENPAMYNKIKPIPFALEGIEALRKLDFEIIYCTHSTNGAAGRKLQWLKDNGFWQENDYYIETKSKHLINADLMIDDGFHNIKDFKGYGLLLDQPWNKNFIYKNRVNGWKQIIDTINIYKEDL